MLALRQLPVASYPAVAPPALAAARVTTLVTVLLLTLATRFIAAAFAAAVVPSRPFLGGGRRLLPGRRLGRLLSRLAAFPTLAPLTALSAISAAAAPTPAAAPSAAFSRLSLLARLSGRGGRTGGNGSGRHRRSGFLDGGRRLHRFVHPFFVSGSFVMAAVVVLIGLRDVAVRFHRAIRARIEFLAGGRFDGSCHGGLGDGGGRFYDGRGRLCDGSSRFGCYVLLLRRCRDRFLFVGHVSSGVQRSA